jgi:5-methylcytosine-specific restriction endonuclease McrA
MKHVSGTKVDYVFLLRHRKQPIQNPKRISYWIIKQKSVNHRKLKYHFDKQNGFCFYCGNTAILKAENDPSQPKKSHATIDHIIPRSTGGLDHRDNMVMACRKCNNRRGVRPVDEFKEMKLNEIRRKLIKNLS